MCSSVTCHSVIKHYYYVQRLNSTYFVLELLKIVLVTLKWEFHGVLSDAHNPWRQVTEINQTSIFSKVFILNFPTKKIPGPDGFIGAFYQTYTRVNTNSSWTFQKQKWPNVWIHLMRPKSSWFQSKTKTS